MSQPTRDEAERFSIGTAARLAGVSQHLIRKWEERYAAVAPSRSGSNRRRFSRADVARLKMLHELTEQGHRIGDVARLSGAQLRSLLDDAPTAASGAPAGTEPDAGPGFERLCRGYLEAVDRFDTQSSADVLARAAALVSFEDFAYRVVLPILREVGQRWERGDFGVAHEHLVSNQLRGLLANRMHWAPAQPTATRVVVATPEGHRHEFGVLVGALLVARHGLEPIYLGPSLPEVDLLRAAADSRAGLVLLSVVRDCDDAELGALAGTLERLAEQVTTWIGLPEGHALVARASGVRYLTSFEDLDASLAEARAVGTL